MSCPRATRAVSGVRAGRIRAQENSLAPRAYLRSIVSRALLGCGVFLSMGVAIAATGYSIERHVIAGGGGTSSGAGYVLSGTIAQPAVDTSRSGSQQVISGFWRPLSAPPQGGPIFRDGFE